MSDETFVVIDTNLLLDDANIIYKLANQFDKLILPLTVLKELDNKKIDINLSYSAREAIRCILSFKREFPNKIEFTNNDNELSTNDLKIMEAALEKNAALATKDISMSIMAESKGLETILYDVVLNNIFNPYIHIDMTKLNEFMFDNGVFDFDKSYSGAKYDIVVEAIEKASEVNVIRNAWFFVIINARSVGEDKEYVYANHPLNNSLIRIDNDPKYLTMTTESTTLKSRDPYQNCAFFALKEAPHVLITGSWGTGKTLLGTGFTLSNSDRKAFITRPPTGISSKYSLGFLPGDKTEKMIDWCSGFLSSLYYLYANTRGQKKSKGVDSNYDYVKDELFPKKFEILPINMIQGLSLLNDDILIVDEVQLLDINYMSMILSRPSETGKLILLGDLKQTYNVVKPSESGLLKLLRTLPHQSLAYVELKNSYRSDLLEIADKLQDKTLA